MNKLIAIDGRPVVPQVDHRADVRMSAVDGGRAGLSSAAFAAVVFRRRGQIVHQVRNLLGGGIADERCVFRIRLIPEVTVANHIGGAAAAPIAAAMGHEQMAHVVEIESPLVAAAVGKDLEFVPHRMITPDTGPEHGALCIGRPGLPINAVLNTP